MQEKSESNERYQMTPQEFSDNLNKLFQKIQISINSEEKQELLNTVDILHTFIHCHVNDM